MKKFAFVAVLTALALSGCGGSKGDASDNSSTVATSSSSTTVESSTTESTVDTSNLKYFYSDKEDIGKLDDLHVSVHSKLGNDNYKELDIMSSDFLPQYTVFIYVDGELTNMDSDLATGLRTATPITVDQITTGVHSLELAQYTDDDDTTEPVLYVKSTYTVK